MSQLRRRDGTPAALGPRGIPRIDGRYSWRATLPEEDARAVCDALGASIAEHLGRGVVTLRLGNTVGLIDAGPLGTLEAVAGKWDAGRWEVLTESLHRAVAALPFEASGAGRAATAADPTADPPLLLQAFGYLRHVVGTPGNQRSALTAPLRSVLARPHRTARRESRPVPTALARRIDGRGLLAIASGQLPMIRSSGPLGQRLGGLAPEIVSESILSSSVDNAENRFVAALLRTIRGILARVELLALAREDTFGRRLRDEISHIRAQLRPLLQHPMWRDVSALHFLAAGSTVLQRRHDYRALLLHHLRLHSGLRLPRSPEELTRMTALRDIADLYELWCGFAVLQALTALKGPPSQLQQPERRAASLSVRWGLMARWGDGTQLRFNQTFTHNNANPRWRSSSLRLRPDLLLEVPTPGGLRRHALDAKFRCDHTRAGPIQAKRADLHKMHTYRDALSLDSGWVLYPGDRSEHYPALGGGPASGVGAVPVDADGPQEPLVALLERLRHA